MLYKDTPIRKKLRQIITLMSGIVLLVTCTTFLIYQFYTFQKATLEKVSTIGKIISINATAALAFESEEDAKEILNALRSEPHIIAAALYNKKGKLFVKYLSKPESISIPLTPKAAGHSFTMTDLEGFYPVVENKSQAGTLYL